MVITKVADNLYLGGSDPMGHPLFLSEVDVPIDVRTCFFEEAVDDDGVPTWKVRWRRLLNIVDATIALTRRGVKVYLHCHGGVDRSPFVAAIFMHREYGMDLMTAYELIQMRRTEVRIHDEWVREYGGEGWIETLTSES